MRQSILILTNDPDIGAMLKITLEADNGYTAHLVSNPTEADAHLAANTAPALVVLEGVLPDGPAWVGRFRGQYAAVPLLIFLPSLRGLEQYPNTAPVDTLYGPFHVDEFLARVKNLLR